jgi:hypothetical protein
MSLYFHLYESGKITPDRFILYIIVKNKVLKKNVSLEQKKDKYLTFIEFNSVEWNDIAQYLIRVTHKDGKQILNHTIEQINIRAIICYKINGKRKYGKTETINYFKFITYLSRIKKQNI